MYVVLTALNDRVYCHRLPLIVITTQLFLLLVIQMGSAYRSFESLNLGLKLVWLEFSAIIYSNTCPA